MTNKSKDQVIHIRFEKPSITDPNYDIIIELFNFLSEYGELPFDPPFVARPPTGKKAVKSRVIYLMAAGMERMKQEFPKREKIEDSPINEKKVESVNQVETAIF